MTVRHYWKRFAFAAFTIAANVSLLHAQINRRPNIVVILSDDMGFSDIGAYGGEIRTPNLDALAEKGKKFTQFYNTARCCPSRAALMTGLYPHQAGVGHLIYDTGHIGYGDRLTSDCVTVAEVLHEAGYSTYMAGKWHLAPRSYNAETDSQFWPTSRGFDKFYGTIAGSGSFYDPSTLCRGTTFITPENDPEYKPEKFYYTDALSDNAIRYVTDHHKQSADKPFFLYLAYTAAHWPIQAPEEEIAAYHGRYDKGYEAIHAERAARLKKMGLVPEVDDLAKPVGDWSKVKDKAVEASLMETYAAMVTRMDKGIGRLVDTLRETGELDNTLIVFLQDNGGCAEDGFGKPRPERDPIPPMKPDEIQKEAQPHFTREGKPVRMGYDVKAGPADTFVAYKENWANVSNTPFRKYKHYVHEGGISTPLIAYWPQGIHVTSETHVVRNPAHLIDLMATFVDLAGAKYPTEHNGVKIQPMEGVSLLPVLKDTGTLARKEPIFFEHESNRAVRDGKWKLVATAKDGPWELYDMDLDRGEMNDLSAKHPELVKKMSAQWNAWAARSRVLPLGGWEDRRNNKKSNAPQTSVKQISLEQGKPLPALQSPDLTGKGLTIVAEIKSGPVEGVIVAQGASFNGYSLYAKDNQLHFVARHDKKLSELKLDTIPPAPFTVGVDLKRNGRVTLTATEGSAVSSTGKRHEAKARFPGALVQTPTQGIAAGTDTETPVGKYPTGFDFKGRLGVVTVHTLPVK